MKKHPSNPCTRREEHFELAVGGSFAMVAAAAALIGAFAPLWAALAVGAAGAWIGVVFDHHLVAPVPAWRIFALAGTLGASIGWVATAAFRSSHEPAGWTAFCGALVAAATVALALLCRPRRP
jgi:hypothetical protein